MLLRLVVNDDSSGEMSRFRNRSRSYGVVFVPSQLARLEEPLWRHLWSVSCVGSVGRVLAL